MGKYKKLIIKSVISLILFLIIFSKIDKQSVVNNLALMNFAYIPLVFVFFVINYFVSSVRWKGLIIYEHKEKVSVWYLTSLYFIGSFFNNFMPTSIGGDVFKVFKLGKRIDSNANAFSSTFMERFLGMVALVTISLFSLIRLLNIWGLALFLGFWACAFVGFYVLKFLSNKVKMFEKIYLSLMLYKGYGRIIFYTFLASFVVQLMAILSQYFIFKSIGVDLPIFYSFFIFPVIILASFFIPSLNGIGVQDLLYIQLFSAVGVPSELSVSASIIYHLFRLFVSLIGGVLYAMGKAD